MAIPEFLFVYENVFFNPIRLGGKGEGGGGRKKLPMLTLNVNNFINIAASDTKVSNFS